MMTRRSISPGRHPARIRGIVGIVAVASFLAALALLFTASAAAMVAFPIAFAASAVVAGADSRDLGHRP
jgi:hypothetical protein